MYRPSTVSPCISSVAWSRSNFPGQAAHMVLLSFALLTSHSTLGAGTSSNLIGVGVFTHVYDLGEGRVRKVPAPDPDNLDLAIKSIRREAEIYNYLGNHPRIINCLARGDFFVDLEFAP